MKTISVVIISNYFVVLSPIVMNTLERKGIFLKYPWSAAPIQMLLCGFFLTFATPMACALFSQKAKIEVHKLEPEIQVKT